MSPVPPQGIHAADMCSLYPTVGEVVQGSHPILTGRRKQITRHLDNQYHPWKKKLK